MKECQTLHLKEHQVLISMERLAELLVAEQTLNLLQRGGVDNWDWHWDSLNPEGEQSIDDITDQINAQAADGTLTP